MAILKRSVPVDLSTLDTEKRTIKVAISSELPYLRLFGYEVLVHTPQSINFERMNAGAPVCWQHNVEDIRGVVESYELGEDGVLRATLRFAKTEEGEKLFQLVSDGIMRQVSIGYMVGGMEQVGEQDGEPLYHVTQWTPYEVSFVSVAADPSVGVGREIDKDVELLCTRAMEQFKKSKEEVVATTTQEAPAAAVEPQEEIQPVEARVEDTPAEGSPNTAQADDDANPEQVRVKSLKALGSAFDAESLAEEFIQSGKTPDEFKSELEAKRSINIIIKKEDKKMFDLNKVMRGLYAGKLDESAVELDAATRSVNADVLKASNARGLSVALPMEAVFSRNYSVGTPEKGGDVIAKEIDGSKFVEALYAKNALGDLGVQIWTLDTQLSIPKQVIVDSVTYGYGETTNAAQHNESEFNLIEYKPHRIAMYARVTNQMMKQSSFDIGALVRNQMAIKFALEQQKMVFGAGGTNQPIGLDGNGITALTGATYANARAKLIEMIVSISSKEGTPGKFLMNHATYWKFAQVKLDDGSGMFLARDGRIEGIEVVLTNAVANDTVYLGAWENVVLTNFGAMAIYLDPQVKAGTMDFVFEAFHDTNVSRPEMVVKSVFTA